MYFTKWNKILRYFDWIFCFYVSREREREREREKRGRRERENGEGSRKQNELVEKEIRGGEKRRSREEEKREIEKRIGKREKSERELSRKLCQPAIFISTGHRYTFFRFLPFFPFASAFSSLFLENRISVYELKYGREAREERKRETEETEREVREKRKGEREDTEKTARVKFLENCASQ